MNKKNKNNFTNDQLLRISENDNIKGYAGELSEVFKNQQFNKFLFYICIDLPDISHSLWKVQYWKLLNLSI